ncbi:MAG TPA: LptF/LptG family permease, partial [Trueperaceae bacterium]|nr:LptF/LptG family permease [Trueperaceae bacterium]
VPPAALLWPLVAFGVLVGVISFVNNGFVEARAEAAYQRRIDEFLYVRPPSELQIDAAYNLDEGVYFAARTRVNQEETSGVAALSGVLVVQADGTTITAPEGQWDAEARVWRLSMSQTTEPGEAPQATGTIELPFELEATPLQTLARPAELPFDELVRQLRRVGRAGGDVAELRYDVHRRIADAFSAAIFAAFAGAIALRVRGREAGFAWTMVLMVLFWALWVLSGDLFTSGALGPITAAWLTPALAAVGAGLIAYRTITR